MKDNHFKQIIQNAVVELGAWAISGAFLLAIIWLKAMLFRAQKRVEGAASTGARN